MLNGLYEILIIANLVALKRLSFIQDTHVIIYYLFRIHMAVHDILFSRTLNIWKKMLDNSKSRCSLGHYKKATLRLVGIIGNSSTCIGSTSLLHRIHWN